jgi:hypothetical protein
VLEGGTTVLEAARELVSLAHTDAIAELEDRRFIIGVASETDHLPVGEVRKRWAASALEEKDVEIARAEELYRTDFLETCRRIVNPPVRMAQSVTTLAIHCDSVTFYEYPAVGWGNSAP